MRQPIGLSLRFKIFQRDHFICQYCGRRPPDVELQVDHIHPVFLGGDNDPDNLITSCRDCNSGKREKVLENHPRAGSISVCGIGFRPHPREAEMLLAVEDAYWLTVDKHLSAETLCTSEDLADEVNDYEVLRHELQQKDLEEGDTESV